jgi:phosphoribosylformimino-5-aminoimidazole carboxamide ribotide isomerase
MILYPATDLMGGQVVRLAQGRFDDAPTYSADPAEALAAIRRAERHGRMSSTSTAPAPAPRSSTISSARSPPPPR